MPERAVAAAWGGGGGDRGEGLRVPVGMELGSGRRGMLRPPAMSRWSSEARAPGDGAEGGACGEVPQPGAAVWRAGDGLPGPRR